MNYYDRYLNVLKKSGIEMFNASIETMNNSKGNDDVVYNVSATMTGPLIFLYISWVIEEAVKNKIKRLYFLSRDGYIMKKVADVIVKHQHINIECRYLYGSRMAWRVPQYHIQGEECLDQICINGINVNLKKIMERGLLTEKEQEKVCNELNINEIEFNRVLNPYEIIDYKDKLKENTSFLKFVVEHSKQAYGSTIGYLEQEKLFDNVKYAIVDSGWTGTLQRSLQNLLDSVEKRGGITGYYFGMYNIPEDLDEKNFNTFLFNKNSGLLEKINFNNNLFECLCCAENGMTTGYKESGGNYIPIFSSSENLNINVWPINNQIETVCEYAINASKNLNGQILDSNKSRKIAFKLCKKSMMNPSKPEVDVYGKFLFSDDITENNVYPLAIPMTKTDLKKNNLLNIVYNKLFVKGQGAPIKKSAWIEGTITKSNVKNAWWYKLNAKIIRLILYV